MVGYIIIVCCPIVLLGIYLKNESDRNKQLRAMKLRIDKIAGVVAAHSGIIRGLDSNYSTKATLKLTEAKPNEPEDIYD